MKNAVLWDRFFAAAGTDIRTNDVKEVIGVRTSPYDNDDMTFEGEFRLNAGGAIRLTAHFSPTYDEILERTWIEAIQY